jgi:pimeloyl-ACP methyl ester carboxylesterase/putative sterol carrier protein
VRARFDLVGFDPRGVARSTPLQCFDTTDDALATLAPFAFPVTRPEERVWVQADRTYARACAERGGPILDHMSTANVARDLDLLRRAVGDAKMTYIGYSHGTAIGSTYANMFPDKVRAVVIDGVIDPVSYTTGRGDQARTLPSDARLRSEQGAYDTLQAFLRLCDAGGPNCAFSGGNPKRRYDRLARRLLAEPAQLPDDQGGTAPFTYADLVNTTLGVLYDASAWPPFAEFLQELDTLTSPARAAASLRSLRQRLGLGARAPYEQVLEGFAGVWCLDPVNPDHASAWARAARRADRRDPYFGRPGSGSAASAPSGRAATATATSARSTAAPPTPCSSSATSTTRRPATRTRSARPGCWAGPPPDGRRVGPHLAVPVLLRRRAREPLPAHRPRPAQGHGLRRGHGPVRPAGRRLDRRPGLGPGLPAAAGPPGPAVGFGDTAAGNGGRRRARGSCPMSQIDASDFSSLKQAVEEKSNEELVGAIQQQEGGVDGVLDKVFAGMSESFNPEKAGGQQAVVQYELSAPDGAHGYAMRIADGRCEIDKGRAESPRVTIRMGLADFLRLITGGANGMQLFMTGKLKVSGDLFFAQTYQSWFDRPQA